MPVYDCTSVRIRDRGKIFHWNFVLKFHWNFTEIENNPKPFTISVIFSSFSVRFQFIFSQFSVNFQSVHMAHWVADRRPQQPPEPQPESEQVCVMHHHRHDALTMSRSIALDAKRHKPLAPARTTRASPTPCTGGNCGLASWLKTTENHWNFTEIWLKIYGCSFSVKFQWNFSSFQFSVFS